jgi:hypothetical protein
VSQNEPLKLKGVPGSPYTRKMLAYLRFRHIPYQLLIGDQSAALGLPEAKVSLLPTFYLPNAEGELEAVVDSTPLIRRFEAEFPGRAAIPTHPVLNFQSSKNLKTTYRSGRFPGFMWWVRTTPPHR